MAIIQGSNLPLICNFPIDIESINIVEIGLYDDKGNKIKHWSRNSWRKEDNSIICPLGETETLNFKPCLATVEVKYVDEDYNVQFFRPVKIAIVKRLDDTRIGV